LSPLFRDPVFDGASDPVLIRNRPERSWWMLYTSRRATAPTKGVGWVHGSDVGIASSNDGGATWCYRGVLNLGHEFGRNTFWAPEVIFTMCSSPTSKVFPNSGLGTTGTSTIT
jgi:hypothetical protein